MRRSNFFWGTLVLLAGVLLFLQQLKIIQINFWQIFWPIALILAGLWFLLGPLFFRRDMEAQSVAVALEGATEADIKLTHAAGRLEISAGAGSSELISGTCMGGAEVKTHLNGSHIKARLKTPEWAWMDMTPVSAGQGLTWNLKLNPNIPMTLKINGGASENIFDLADVRVSDLQIETGASSTMLTLPARAGFTRAEVKSGAASMDVSVPQGVAMRIQVKSGLASVEVDQSRFPKGAEYYQSPDYDTAANRIELSIETGVGSVTVR